MTETNESFALQLQLFNELSYDAAYGEFLRCCGSTRWAKEMTERMPYENFSQLKETAWNIWWSMPKEEFMMAFSAHPKIGTNFYGYFV